MKPIDRRDCLGVLAAGLLAGRATAQAGSYPSKAIKLVVPYPPGGGNDLLSRSLKTHWEKAWGQPVIVENKPGGNGSLGTEFVSKTPGDGYTLLMGSVATHVTSPLLKGKSSRYDPVKDFTPIAMMGSTPLILTVHPSVKANNLREFVALAKSKKESITYASVGNGSAGHLAGAMFEQMSGADMMHIPYKGIAQASTELIGGLVNAAFSNVLNVLPLIRSGKLKALGVTSKEALSVLPEVPPISSVLTGYEAELWWGVFAPAGLSADVVKKINQETNKYLNLPEMKKKWAEEAITLNPLTVPEFSNLIERERKIWSDLVVSKKITEET